MKNRSKKYHSNLAEYFYAKYASVEDQVLNNYPIRTLSEITYQCILAEVPEHVENLLCNPMFLEKSIRKGLLINLLNDINLSVKEFNLVSIQPIKEAIYNGLAAINQRPENSIYSIVNRLIHLTASEPVNRFLTKAIEALNRRGVWLCSETRLPSAQQITNVFHINSRRNSFYRLAENSLINEYYLDTQVLKSIHKSYDRNSISKISIHPISNRIAYLFRDGSTVIDSERSNFILEPRNSCFAWFDNGLLGISKQHKLVYIDLSSQIETIVSEDEVPKFSELFVSDDTKTAVLISGDRFSDQKVFLIRSHSGPLQITAIASVGSLIKTVGLDPVGENIILVTSSRELHLFNLKSGGGKKVSYRIASDLPVQGVVDNCLLDYSANGNLISVLATNLGELLAWDCMMQQLIKLGEFKGIRQQSSLNCYQLLPIENEIVVATEEDLKFISIKPNDNRFINSPVNQCVLSNDGWFITINEHGRKVIWFKNGKFYADRIIQNFQPTSITTLDRGGIVAVGYKNGLLAKLCPDNQDDDFIKPLFDHPIVSVCNFGSGRILAASNKGHFKLFDFSNRNIDRHINPIGNVRSEEIIIVLGKGDDFVTSGHYHHGTSLSTVNVIRANDSHEVVFETTGIINDIATSEDSSKIFISVEGFLYCYRYRRRKWVFCFKYEAGLTKISTVQKNQLAAILNYKGMNWLELWDCSDSVKKLAVIELPVQCSSIASNNEYIGIGTMDGNHMLVKIHK